MQTVQKLNKDNSDNIYYNIALTNNSSDSVLPCNFSVNLTDSIIDNPSNYYLAICRATVPLQALPIFTFKTGLYWVYLNVGGSTNQQEVIFVPFGPSSNIPKGIYSYRYMLDLINTALKASYMGIPVKPVGVSEAPFMTYESSSGLFSFWCQQSYVGTVEVWFSTELYDLFDNFDTSYYTLPSLTNPIYKCVQLKIINYGNNAVNTLEHPNYLQFIQEYNSKYNWNDLRQIVFKSFTIPIVNEYAPQNVTEGTINSSSGIINYTPELTDIEPISDPSSGLRDIVTYQPNPQYRLVDLISNLPLKKIDMQIVWRDNSLTEHQLVIAPGYTATVKIGFFRKDLYKFKY